MLSEGAGFQISAGPSFLEYDSIVHVLKINSHSADILRIRILERGTGKGNDVI